METASWQSRILDYVAYNRSFVANERQEVVAVETKRRSQPRSLRIRKGELFEATQVRRLKMYKYEFTAMRPLPHNHHLQLGQVVELRIGDNRKGSDGQKEEMRTLSCEIVLKGTVTTKTKEQVLLRRLEIEFSEDAKEHLLFEFIRSHSRGESEVLKVNGADAKRMEIEIAADTTTFDRMNSALVMLSALKSKPVWLSAAIGTRGSCGTLKELVDASFTIDEPSTVDEQSVSGKDAYKVTTDTDSSLNPSQQQAVEYSLRSHLTLIHGPPGK
jgi:hypothetical protein